jgi:predicted DNA-binding protein
VALMIEMDEQLTIRIPAELGDRLRAEAKRSARSMSGMVRYALLTFAEQLPDAAAPVKRTNRRATKRS